MFKLSLAVKGYVVLSAKVAGNLADLFWDDNRIRRCGQYHRHALRSRYYNTAMGRIQTEDTYFGGLNIQLTLNRYSYIMNNMVNYIDLSGHMAAKTFTNAVHEGTHAIDFINNIDILTWAGELKAYEAERVFQLATGLPVEFESMDDVLVHIFKQQ